MGWNWVRQIARFNEVWVITRAKNREPIERALAQEPLSNAHFVYFDLPRWARSWKKGQRGVHAYYYLWQLGAYFVAKKLHGEVGFDLVHHVTFVIYWMPSFLALLPAPFVWGPVGGGESAPRALRRCFGLQGKLYETLRDLARTLAELDPFVRLTAQRAAVGFATTEATAARLRALGCRKVKVLSQVALPGQEIARLGGFPVRQSNPFRLISIGNLLHWKGFELGLRAFACFKSKFPASEYWIIGDGPERKRLDRVAEELSVAGSVTFLGTIPRWQVLEKLCECDVLVHPSLHDSGGWVCVEAMAARRPVVCLDLGGPALQVTEETGIKVSAISPEQAVRDLAAALTRLRQDATLRVRMGEAAQRRADGYWSWQRKAELVANVYEQVRIG